MQLPLGVGFVRIQLSIVLPATTLLRGEEGRRQGEGGRDILCSDLYYSIVLYDGVWLP